MLGIVGRSADGLVHLFEAHFALRHGLRGLASWGGRCGVVVQHGVRAHCISGLEERVCTSGILTYSATNGVELRVCFEHAVVHRAARSLARPW
jgi:hypothetical protein